MLIVCVSGLFVLQVIIVLLSLFFVCLLLLPFECRAVCARKGGR